MLGEMESRAGIAPASWWPCASTFATRRLNCSANGIEIESAGGSFSSRLRGYLVLAFLNRSLIANKVRDHSVRCRLHREDLNEIAGAIERTGCAKWTDQSRRLRNWTLT